MHILVWNRVWVRWQWRLAVATTGQLNRSTFRSSGTASRRATSLPTPDICPWSSHHAVRSHAHTSQQLEGCGRRMSTRRRRYAFCVAVSHVRTVSTAPPDTFCDSPDHTRGTPLLECIHRNHIPGIAMVSSVSWTYESQPLCSWSLLCEYRC